MEMFGKKVVVVALLCMVVIAIAPGTEALTCGQVMSGLSSCLPYLMNMGPLGGCCTGVKNLVGAAKTAADRRTACTCLKSAAGSYKNLNLVKAANLPSTCGVPIPYKISPSTDCSRVN